jgi:hypothetical protein
MNSQPGGIGHQAIKNMGLGPSSEIQDPEKTYSGSRGQKSTGSRIRISNTGLNSTEEIIKDVMLIIFIYIYKLIICKIQIINCKGAYRNAEWGERPADTGPGMEKYPAMYIRDLRIRALAWKCIQQLRIRALAWMYPAMYTRPADTSPAWYVSNNVALYTLA